MSAPTKSFSGILKDSLNWNLKRSRPFIINDEYRVELIKINNDGSSRIRITNLKTMESEETNDVG